MSEAYEDFVAEWQRRHADEPYMLEVMPSYDVVRYAMKKLPEVVKQKGRVTGSEYRQLEGFTRRDWTAMPVNYVWIGDGHGMKLKCAHPIHGRPFSPEITFVMTVEPGLLLAGVLTLPRTCSPLPVRYSTVFATTENRFCITRITVLVKRLTCWTKRSWVFCPAWD